MGVGVSSTAVIVVMSMCVGVGRRAVDSGAVIMRMVVHGNILRGLHRACSGV